MASAITSYLKAFLNAINIPKNGDSFSPKTFLEHQSKLTPDVHYCCNSGYDSPALSCVSVW